MRAQGVPLHDAFGNALDPVVGFARGDIIRSSVDEARRLRHGQRIAAERVRRLGPGSIGVFTGSQRGFPLEVEDLATHCEEWVGPGLFAEALRRAAIRHLGGLPGDGAAVVNRTSAGIIAAILALCGGRDVVSVVPAGGRSHASLMRGAALAGVALHERQADQDWAGAIAQQQPALVLVTTVTSSLEFLDDALAIDIAAFARRHAALVFFDEAYGARLRPVLRGGAPGLQLGGDLAITNCDKAGLYGPRAGLLVGRAGLVSRVEARACELGMEARAPVAASALRSIERFSPDELLENAESGRQLGHALRQALGAQLVGLSALGPVIEEDLAMKEVFRRASLSYGGSSLKPAEITSALGAVMLRDHGMLTVNTHGQPGARVSIRLKPTHGAVERCGGLDEVVSAVRASFEAVARIVDRPGELGRLILGDTP